VIREFFNPLALLQVYFILIQNPNLEKKRNTFIVEFIVLSGMLAPAVIDVKRYLGSAMSEVNKVCPHDDLKTNPMHSCVNILRNNINQSHLEIFSMQ